MKKLIALITLTCSPFYAHAVIFGSSNLGFTGYPDANCTKPFPPTKPFSFSNQWELDSYNSEIDSYNLFRAEYVNCIKEYIEAADNDIKRIKENVNNAIDEANSPS